MSATELKQASIIQYMQYLEKYVEYSVRMRGVFQFSQNGLACDSSCGRSSSVRP